MQHYFINKEHKESDFFKFEDSILNYKLCFRSCDSIFSKNKIDDGTRALLEAIDKKEQLFGHGLDIGCGLGVIAITLIKRFGVTFDMIDINETAVKLSRENLQLNNVQKNAKVLVSNGFENLEEMYDFIVTNPPIKTGKKLLFQLITDAYSHMNNNAPIILVIRKDHGMESLKKHMVSVINNCEIIDRNKGYYILKSIKNN